MTKIISFTPVYHFGVYEHKVHNRKELSKVRMIVLKNEYNQIIYYTGLEQFSYPYTGQLPKKKERLKAELVYICAALNYIFGHSRIAKIADITAEHVFGFFDSYCNTPKGDSENIMRQQQSLDKCVKAVTNFFANLSQVFPMCLTVEDLMNYEETKANKHSHRIVRRHVPRYVPQRPHSYEYEQLRDMPWEAAKRLVELAYYHDPTLHPELAEEWDYENNGDLRPEQFTAKSSKRIWWKCKACGQSWLTSIANRAQGKGCPFDAGQRPIPNQTDLPTLCPDLAKEWDYARNGNLRPEQFAAKSGRKVWWKCRNCAHSWRAAIACRTNGTGCPRCNSGRKR